ncbi:MAG: PhzF family phenazine biosynthesis protein [Holosporales bacterium]|jgi:PhzF family phenazine biosynthesis protein|nr:PhzF family phenazine biosynthesis protein [Holosporales bacterium]
MNINFWIVDTFSEKRFNGSPSAVIFSDDINDDHLMQKIAMELNTPETIFVKRSDNGDFEVSCFSPFERGISFGNGMFASAHIIFTEKMVSKDTINLIFGSRIFEIHRSDDEVITTRLSAPGVSKTTMSNEVIEAFNGENIVSVAESKGALIVEIRSPRKVANLDPNIDVLRHMEYALTIVTADTHYETDVDYDFCTRVFAPRLGVFEDSVTPLAHSRLAVYWQERIGKNEMVGCQKSRSNSYVNVRCADKYVYISGRNITLTKGTLFL